MTSPQQDQPSQPSQQEALHEPQRISSTDETEWLLRVLQVQRDHVLDTLDGLADADALKAVLPSQWSLAGMVRHLDLGVEDFWFRAVVAGKPLPSESDESANDEATDSEWQVPEGVSVAQVVESYRAACARADDIVRSKGLDASLAWWPDFFGPAFYQSVRQVVMHCITETATHAGQADAVRELIDGHQHFVIG